MKKFVLRTLLFSLFCIVPMAAVFMAADGSTDAFYERFTVSRQQAMVLGSSRAAHAMQPVYLDSVLQKKWPGIRMFNYAFTRSHSPYGPAYYNSVVKKLDPASKNSVFILCVDAWVLTKHIGKPADSLVFEEDERFVGTTRFVNLWPNVDYLMNSYPYPYWDVLLNRIKRKQFFLHDNGWLEVTYPMNEDSISRRTKSKVAYYEDLAPYEKMSNDRVAYLKKTIELFKEHGSVFLVKLPVCEELQNLERETFPTYPKVIEQVADTENVPYFDLNNIPWQPVFVDGEHTSKATGKRVSIDLAEMIIKYQSDSIRK